MLPALCWSLPGATLFMLMWSARCANGMVGGRFDSFSCDALHYMKFTANEKQESAKRQELRLQLATTVGIPTIHYSITIFVVC